MGPAAVIAVDHPVPIDSDHFHLMACRMEVERLTFSLLMLMQVQITGTDN